MTALRSMLLRKVRGVRIVDLGGAACLVAIVLLVYGSKAGAGAEAAKIADATRQISAEEQEVRMLRAERAYLTQPERLRRLSSQYLSMGPIAANRDTTPEALLQLHQAPAAPATIVAQPTQPQPMVQGATR